MMAMFICLSVSLSPLSQSATRGSNQPLATRHGRAVDVSPVDCDPQAYNDLLLWLGLMKHFFRFLVVGCRLLLALAIDRLRSCLHLLVDRQFSRPKHVFTTILPGLFSDASVLSRHNES